MKKLPLGILVVGFGCVGFWLLAPAYIKDKAYGIATYNTPERQCFRDHLSSFQDPATAYVESSYRWTKDDDIQAGGSQLARFEKTNELIKVKVRAKNRLGAYGETYVSCYSFGSAGVVAYTE